MAIALIILAAMTGLGFAHQLGSHYFLINYDSFYFHDLARAIAAGAAPPLTGSGLAYPIGIAGRLIGVDTAALIAGPLLAILTGLVLYWGVSQLFTRRVAIWSVLCFATAQIPRLIFLSGNIDRDGLHILLMTAGILALGLLLRTGRSRYLVILLVTIPLFYLEWGWYALAQYIPTLCGIIVLSKLRVEWLSTRWLWLGFGFLCLVAWGLGRLILRLSIFGGTSITELDPISMDTVFLYATLALPVYFGLRQIIRSQDRRDVFLVAWAAVFLASGFFASRLSVAAPVALSVIGGIGYAAMADQGKVWNIDWRWVPAAACITMAAWSWMVPQNMVMPRAWHQALNWLDDNVSVDQPIITWWSYGHWIHDQTGLVAPASQATDPTVPILADIYWADSEEAAREIMLSHHWHYLVMSTREEHFVNGSIRDRATDPADQGFYHQVMQENYTSSALIYDEGGVRVIFY